MIYSSLCLGLALLPFVHSKNFEVAVGKGGLTFNPPALSAEIGDNVIFTFFAKNHTVTQTAFGSVCQKKEGGLDSGFNPVAANTTDNFPTFTVPVTTKDPLWFYCAQAAGLPASHCGAGMVFSINCPFEGDHSFDNFKKQALDIGKSLQASGGDASSAATAAYGGYTLPPQPAVVVVTQPVTVGSSSWTTTYSSYPGSPAPTPASLEGKVHTVVVGGSGGLVFTPPHLDGVAPRDTVVFEFHQKNHSVVQSTFADPCRKKDGGFSSGLQPVADSVTTGFPTFNITVNGTEPIWAYCGQKLPTSHCGAGMVFGINTEGSARNFSAFQDLAKAMNGTAAAANAPPQPTNAAIGVSLPLSSLIVMLGAVVLGSTL